MLLIRHHVNHYKHYGHGSSRVDVAWLIALSSKAQGRQPQFSDNAVQPVCSLLMAQLCDGTCIGNKYVTWHDMLLVVPASCAYGAVDHAHKR